MGRGERRAGITDKKTIPRPQKKRCAFRPVLSRFNTPSWGPKMAISLETSSQNGAFIDLVLASLLEGPQTAQHSPTRRPKRAPGWPKLASTWPQNGLQEGSRRSKMTSKTAQERPRGYKTVKSAPRRPKMASRRPKRLQRSPKRAPRGPPEMAPRCLQDGP